MGNNLTVCFQSSRSQPPPSQSPPNETRDNTKNNPYSLGGWGDVGIVADGTIAAVDAIGAIGDVGTVATIAAIGAIGDIGTVSGDAAYDDANIAWEDWMRKHYPSACLDGSNDHGACGDFSTSACVGNSTVGAGSVGASTCSINVCTSACFGSAAADDIKFDCDFVKGKVPIPFKAQIRKRLSDKNITDPYLKAISARDCTSEMLIDAWRNPTTPPVLMCLIADIFHKHGREMELGPLPSYYIPPRQKKRGNGRGKRSDEYVSCIICNDRGRGCKCCRVCNERVYNCTCGNRSHP